MERPTIIIEGKKHEMKNITGGDWGKMGKFLENPPKYPDADFIEKHAEFIAQFFDVTVEEILEKMALEDILPTTREIQSRLIHAITAKMKVIEKNSLEDEAAE